MASAILREELLCSICLSLYTDPVTLRCEHNFCRECIDDELDTQDEAGVYSCPVCREKFNKRPTLKRNITLCNVAERFLSTQPPQEEITGIRKELQCSICMNVYTDPITLRCGHSFCRDCINNMQDTDGGSGVYSCPECRATFRKWPPLQRSISLCNVVENILSTPSHQDEITWIRCTYCIHHTVPAVRSCLHCEASMCDNHLKVHSKGPEHVLTDPSTSLENRKCSVHKKILEYYCTEDAACICVSCSLTGKHQGHQVEMLEEASMKKRKKLRNVLQKLITYKKKSEERVRSLEENRRTAQEKASGEAKKVTALFVDFRRRLDDLERKVLSEISRREEQMSLLLSDVIQKLEIQMDELSRKMRHIEELCNMTDPLTVLQEPDTGDLCDPEEEGDEDTGGHDGGDQVAELISHISNTLSDMMRDVNVTFPEQDPADILLDVNTAHNNLLISDDLKTATWTEITLNRPETAERFQDSQVMSNKGFTSGRHYWDVEGHSSGGWMVGMCYSSIDRRGRQLYIGNNNKSWCLYGGLGYTNNEYSVRHSNNEIRLPHPISSNRFRICLDYEAGQLSFYELCDPIRHLHTFTAAFSEPLHAVLYVYGCSIKISGGAVRSHNHKGNLPVTSDITGSSI
ncbi:E3 ubiquitin-protein ligase TRIM39-like [Anomaloglossus baeobatrachus]|uniref:E3 ubiquitin-protein ligase TRIM39-like n=1 Tax=Anomaloglossus baeobatrachus TaxID=238106 RepID=UPI003F5084C8